MHQYVVRVLCVISNDTSVISNSCIFFYSDINFQLNLSPGSCDSIDTFNEGVEFSIQMNSKGVWIPITLVIRSDLSNRSNEDSIGYHENQNVVIRDYHVQTNLAIGSYSVQVCNFADSVNDVKFRWLQTSFVGTSGSSNLKDLWSLDNVEIVYNSNGISISLLQDSFDDFELK